MQRKEVGLYETHTHNWTREEQHSEAKMMIEGQKLNSTRISKCRRYPKIKTKFWKMGNRGDETGPREIRR